MKRSKLCISALIVLMLVGTLCYAAMNQAAQTEKNGWKLGLIVPTTITKSSSQSCAVLENAKVHLFNKNGGRVPNGPGNVVVTITILDRDPFRDDVIVSKTYRFNGGEEVRISNDPLCGNMKADRGKTSEIYVKAKIQYNVIGSSLGFIDNSWKTKLSTRGQTRKVKIVKGR